MRQTAGQLNLLLPQVFRSLGPRHVRGQTVARVTILRMAWMTSVDLLAQLFFCCPGYILTSQLNGSCSDPQTDPIFAYYYPHFLSQTKWILHGNRVVILGDWVFDYAGIEPGCVLEPE